MELKSLDVILERIVRHSDHDHDHDDKNDGGSGNEAVIAKGTAMACLFLASMFFGLVPFKLVQWFNWHQTGSSANGPNGAAGSMDNTRAGTIVSLMLAFGGGVLLCTTFLHLLPEVNENISGLQAAELLPTLPFHLPEFLMCMGFFMMYLIEELVHTFLHKHQKNAKNAEKAFQRGQNVRKSILVAGKRKKSGGDQLAPSISIAELIDNDAMSEKFRSDMTHVESTTVSTIAKSDEYSTHQHPHHHHGHSHLPPTGTGNGDDAIVSSIRGLLIVMALSIHELFEGLAVGLERSASNVWYMFGAVAAHKLVLAFCVGLELIVTGTKRYLAIVYIVTFAAVSPIGIGIGILVTDDQSDDTRLASGFLQGLACGTLLYVVFFEILQKKRSGLRTVAAVFIGFSVMFGLQFISKFLILFYPLE